MSTVVKICICGKEIGDTDDVYFVSATRDGKYTEVIRCSDCWRKVMDEIQDVFVGGYIRRQSEVK